MTPTPRKLSDEELAHIIDCEAIFQDSRQGWAVDDHQFPRANKHRTALLSHIAALESEWPKCKHGEPLDMMRRSGGTHYLCGNGYCCDYVRGDTPDAALAAFRAANRKTELGGDER